MGYSVSQLRTTRCIGTISILIQLSPQSQQHRCSNPCPSLTVRSTQLQWLQKKSLLHVEIALSLLSTSSITIWTKYLEVIFRFKIQIKFSSILLLISKIRSGTHSCWLELKVALIWSQDNQTTRVRNSSQYRRDTTRVRLLLEKITRYQLARVLTM